MRRLLTPRYYFGIIRNILLFTLKPKPSSLIKKEGPVYVQFIAIFLIAEIFSILGVLPKALLEEYDLINDLENILSQYKTTWPEWKLLLVGGFIAPLLEEVTWRLHLKYNKWYVLLSISGATYYVTGWFLGDYSAVNLMADYSYRVMASLIILLILYFIFLNPKYESFFKQFWDEKFRIIYWFMIVSFALMHVDRYQNFGDFEHYIILPLIVLPQIISGSIFGFVRVNYGFRYALALHMLGNTYLQLITNIL